MKLLKTIKHIDLFSKSKAKDPRDLKLRSAARAVALDNEGLIAILHAANLGYHKLPGGGVKRKETILNALHREISEEIGCRISVVKEIGKIVELKDRINERQESYCFLAKLVGKKGKPHFIREEIKNGFEVRWVKLDEAIKILRNDHTEKYQGKFIKIRDLCFLEEAKKIMNKENK